MRQILFVCGLILVLCGCRGSSVQPKPKGAFATGEYPNLFTDLLGVPSEKVDARVMQAWDQLFYGDGDTERVYYPVAPDMAYIKDVLHNDVRSEGMSYGMMIAVQLNKKEAFDRMWKWAKTFMQHQSGPRKGYFAWNVGTDGVIRDPNSASDGEEWFVTALFFASARWGDGEGVTDYHAEAQTILDAMLGKSESSDSDTVITNMFNRSEKQVVFVPVGNADDFSDPSYHVPHFYDVWAMEADRGNAFWADAADVSRAYFEKAAHPKTGLTPDYAGFDGTPVDPPWGGGHDAFRFDAWRTVMNAAVDYVWFRDNPDAPGLCNRLLDFFFKQGLDTYVNQYTLDGKPLSTDRSSGLTAMNAAACLAATHPNREAFVRALWEQPVPSGLYRYYDGLLTMLGLLQVSGQFRIYTTGSD